MPRYTNPTLWDRDWFLDLGGKYQLFCMYLRDHCNHAGIWHPSFKLFESSTGFRINSSDYLSTVNKDGSTRILVLENKKWWIVGFIEDQLPGIVLRISNNYHKGIINSLEANNVPYLSYSYRLDPPMALTCPTGAPPVPLLGSQDKEEDKDIDKGLFPLKEEVKEEPNWRTSYQIYEQEVGAAFDKLVADPAWMQERKKYHPNLDIYLSMEKALNDFWGQEAGWKHKKKSRSKEIDWDATFKNALTMKANQVYEKR